MNAADYKEYLMLKFFFNRFSVIVRVSEIAGLIFLLILGRRIFLFDSNSAAKVLIICVAITYALIRVCAMVHWHGDAKRFTGIELQFKKALVPTAYIMTICNAAAIVTGTSFFLATELVLLIFMAHVNLILLWLFRKDNETLPVASLSKRAS